MTTGSLKSVSEQLDRRAVERVAKLARLELTSEELDEATTRLAGMLAHFADIDALNLEDVEPMTQPYELVNVMRDDVPLETLDHDEVLAAAQMHLMADLVSHRSWGLNCERVSERAVDS